jgi:Ca-activated chloride channel family protein
MGGFVMKGMDRKMLRSNVTRLGILVVSWVFLLMSTLGSAPGLGQGREGSGSGGPAADALAALSPARQTQDLFLKLKSELVVLPISVTDSWGRFIPGLKREQFDVYEQEVPQSIRFFSTEDTPISVGVILDISGSMKHKIARALEAVRRFVEFSNPQDEFFAITFNNRVSHLADFCDGEMLINYFLFLETKGRTAVYDAVYEGVVKLQKARYGKRVLLLVSDGQDNASRYGPRSVSQLLKESDVQIYSIGIPDPTRYDDYFERQGLAILQQLSRPTGGRHFTVSSASGLEPVCIYIARELRQQYTLGYLSSNPARDGQWRRVKVNARPEMNFKLTNRSLQNLKEARVPPEVLEKLGDLKDVKIKALGEEEYFSFLKTKVGGSLSDEIKPAILGNVNREDSGKLRVFTKRGYYAPRTQP